MHFGTQFTGAVLTDKWKTIIYDVLVETNASDNITIIQQNKARC